MKKDIILVQNIKNGDIHAQEKLYYKYKKRIDKYLSIKYPNDKDHDDSVSEILIKIFENINQFDNKRAKFHTWAIKIANNYMIDKARKNENNPVQVRYDTTSMDGTLCLYNSSGSFTCGSSDAIGTTTSDFQPRSFSQPDIDVENKDALDFISNRIGIKDFHLLNMKYKEGYDYKEIESEMKLSSSTASNRVNYVKSKLKKGK
jgi:RNA polymerase sigma factor (sigma-70 family)